LHEQDPEIVERVGISPTQLERSFEAKSGLVRLAHEATVTAQPSPCLGIERVLKHRLAIEPLSLREVSAAFDLVRE
jgi:hypothetical protein